MQTFRHRFDNIEQYLHHRPPYLMVDRILWITAQEIVMEKQITGDEFFLPGHFPGAPIVPGAMLQELTTQSAGALIAAEYNPMALYDTSDPQANAYALGVLVRVKHARYRHFARTGDQLQATVRLQEQVGAMFQFSATVTRGEQVLMRNEFQLTNVPSTLLAPAAV